MGAGFCFNNDELSGAFHVDGEPVSLRAEAAAMYHMLVAARGSDKALAVMCDSLGLLQLLRGYRKQDFVYHDDMTAHFDLIRLILQELNKRKSETILIKVKSHVGIELNETADVLAKQGLSEDIDTLPAVERKKWPLWIRDPTTSLPMHKSMLFKVFRKSHFTAQHLVWTRTAGITTWQFTTPGQGQQYYSKANKHLSLGNKRTWMLIKADMYPTNFQRFRMGKVDSNTCSMQGCIKRETWDHAVCSCPIISKAARAAHDKVWRGIFQVIQSSVKDGIEATYDTKMSSITHIKSSPSIKNLQPDGVLYDMRQQTIKLLEFTRTGDLWLGSLERARLKKSDKYSMLATELTKLHPGWAVTVVPFVCGARSYIDEQAWAAEWEALGLSSSSLRKLLPRVQAWNVEAAKEILSVRATIKKGDR